MIWKKLYWERKHPEERRRLLKQVTAVSPKGLHESWYYHIDFGYGVEVRRDLRGKADSGLNNWNRFLLPNLPDLAGKRILNIGCNAGLYDLGMVDAGAAGTIGLDFSADQGNFLKQWFGSVRGRDYSAATFIGTDITMYDLGSLGWFDLVNLFCVIYHLGAAAEHVMSQITDMTPTVAMQGNLPRLTSLKYRKRSYQELAGIDGMTEMLTRHGFTAIDVCAPRRYPKPLVIGRKPSG